MTRPTPTTDERKRSSTAETGTPSANGRGRGARRPERVRERPGSGSRGRPASQLQRSRGNQAVQRLVRSGATWATADAPGDRYGREADRAAEQVTRTPKPAVRRTCACGNRTTAGGECAECREKRLSRKQRRGTDHDGSSTVPSIVTEVLRSAGRPLDPTVRASMEPRFGHDFGRVRVHHDQKAAASARAVNAMAYTVGRDVVFGAGQYAPESPSGRRLIAHELTHTIQQRAAGGSVQALSVDGEATAAEREADAAVESLANGGRPRVTRSVSAPALRRKRGSGEPLGGCGVCFRYFPGGLQYGGAVVHGHIQTIAKLRDPSLLVDEPLVGMGYAKEGLTEILGSLGATEAVERPKGTDIPDILDPVAEEPGADRKRVEYLEIKPDNPKGIEDGKAAAERYKRRLKSMDEFRGADVRPKTNLTLPPIPLYGDGRPDGCPRQHIHVRLLRFRDRDGDMNAIYLYSCAPAFSELVRKPECRRCSNKDKDKKKKGKKGEKKPAKEAPKKPAKEAPKKPAAKGKPPGGKGGNYGIGIAINSSGGGAGNVTLGIAINSSGTAFGTVGAGIVYDSHGNAIGTVGAGVSSGSTATVAGTAGVGAARDTDVTAAGAAGAGAAQRTKVTGAGIAGAGTAQDVDVTAVGVAGTGEAKDVTGPAGGETTPEGGVPSGQPGAERPEAGATGAGTEKTAPAPQGEAFEAAQAEAQRAEKALAEATAAQTELLRWLASRYPNRIMPVRSGEWFEKFIAATKHLTPEQIKKLQQAKWEPDPGISVEEFRRRVDAALAGGTAAGDAADAEKPVGPGKETKTTPGETRPPDAKSKPPEKPRERVEVKDTEKVNERELLEWLRGKIRKFNYGALKTGEFGLPSERDARAPFRTVIYMRLDDGDYGAVVTVSKLEDGPTGKHITLRDSSRIVRRDGTVIDHRLPDGLRLRVSRNW